jgi:hypothetical protein
VLLLTKMAAHFFKTMSLQKHKYHFSLKRNFLESVSLFRIYFNVSAINYKISTFIDFFLEDSASDLCWIYTHRWKWLDFNPVFFVGKVSNILSTCSLLYKIKHIGIIYYTTLLWRLNYLEKHRKIFIVNIYR